MRFAPREGDLVIVTPPAQLSDVIVDTLLAELTAHLSRGEPYVLLFNLSSAGVPNAIQRRKLAEHMATHDVSVRRVVRGLAIVAPSPLIRGMVTAMFWIVAPPIPYQMCGTLAEARTWAQGIMPNTHLVPGRPSA